MYAMAQSVFHSICAMIRSTVAITPRNNMHKKDEKLTFILKKSNFVYMKTVTAKEFRDNQTAIIKAIKAGEEYLLTSHRKPVARLLPVKKAAPQSKPPRGSYAAVQESLKYTYSTPEKDLQKLSYKELRARAMQAKYGDGQVYKRRQPR